MEPRLSAELECDDLFDMRVAVGEERADSGGNAAVAMPLVRGVIDQTPPG